MERAAIACELRSARGAVEFSIAAPEDDAEIRRLLRENPMRGTVSISLEREPNYFDGSSLGASRDITIVARKNGRLVCVGSCSMRRRFVNGESMPVGYLGGLRLDRSVEGRFDILRQGYRFFERIAANEEAQFYFTSIASDNIRARQFLERNVAGMPEYTLIGEFVTFVMPARRKRIGSKTVASPELGEGRLNQNQRRYQLSTEWQEDELAQFEAVGLGPAIEVRSSEGEVGCGILWNQQCFKQTVVRGFSPLMKLARPLLNAVSRFTGVRLPAEGCSLNLAFLSPVCATEATIAILVERALEAARKNGIALVAIGLDRRDPALKKVVNSFRGREYHSRIYAVRWPDAAAVNLDDRLLMPEVALL